MIGGEEGVELGYMTNQDRHRDRVGWGSAGGRAESVAVDSAGMYREMRWSVFCLIIKSII